MYKDITDYIKSLYPGKDFVPLHAPVFIGNEKKYLNECIDSTFVSYVGQYVTRFEEMVCQYTGAKHAIAIVNGTCALQVALEISGVKPGDEVITQSVTFVASANAIVFAQAIPVFIDSDKTTLGLSSEKLEELLSKNCKLNDHGECINLTSGKRVAACVPMHVFGHPVEIEAIINICKRYNIIVIEDAAESLGSFYKNQHTGTFGLMGILSFNGNKTVTTGGGGMIITNDEALAKRAKYTTTTAKIPHPWEFYHEESGYNFRLTNVNAAIGCAQMESLPAYIENKRQLAELYRLFFEKNGIAFYTESVNCKSNYWLNLIFLKNREERDVFLKYSNENGVMTRPFWTLMHKLPMFKNCQRTNMETAQWLEDRGVNIPSSVRL